MREDEALRIIPKPLWDRVRERRKAMHRTWPGGNGKRGFSKEQRGRQAHFPTHLLAGSMVCGCCGATIAQVSGKSGGYYGCLAATKGACENKTLVRRTLAERIILQAVQEQISDPEHIAYVLRRVEEEIGRQRTDLPDTLKLKEAELAAEQRRLGNFVDFIGRGPRQPSAREGPRRDRAASRATHGEVDSLQRSREKIFRPANLRRLEFEPDRTEEVAEHLR